MPLPRHDQQRPRSAGGVATTAQPGATTSQESSENPGVANFRIADAPPRVAALRSGRECENQHPWSLWPVPFPGHDPKVRSRLLATPNQTHGLPEAHQPSPDWREGSHPADTPSCRRRQRGPLMPCQFRREFDAGEHILSLKAREGFQHFLHTVASRQQLQYRLRGDASAFDDRFAVADIRPDFEAAVHFDNFTPQ